MMKKKKSWCKITLQRQWATGHFSNHGLGDRKKSFGITNKHFELNTNEQSTPQQKKQP